MTPGITLPDMPATTDEKPIPSTASSIAPMVLHVRVVTQTGGGPDKTILNSPRYLQRFGYDSRCAYMYPPNDLGFNVIRSRAAQCGAPLDAVEDRGFFDVSVVRRLLQLCRKYDVGIWHGHDYKSNAIGLLIKRFRPMHLVTTMHGWVHFTKKTPLFYAIDRMCLRRYEHVLCVSKDLVSSALAAGVPPTKCHLVENAIDTNRFRRTQPSSTAKDGLGLSAHRFVIGAIGRLSAEKDFARLIDAIQPLIPRRPDICVVIVGEGDQRPQLANKIQTAGIQEHVRLLGFRSDVHQLLQAMDLFVLSSAREGLPNALLEAMACEVPVVATRVAGVPDIIRQRHTGLLIPPEDTDALTRAIGEVLDDHELRRRMASQARDVVCQEYSFADRIRKVASFYDQLLQT